MVNQKGEKMKKPEYLGPSSGGLARLIPVVTQQELRNTCVTCAMLMAVEEFAETLLGRLGAPTGKRMRVHIWLEPVFKSLKDGNEDRPDALIIVNNGRREWRAILEAKAKGADLDSSQVERYLDIAKDHRIDAVLTISNQFVATSSQSPCVINQKKLKKVNLFHWSWSYLKTEAKIQLSQSAVSDPDQAYMLNEYVRYLEHDSAGVSEFEQMGKDFVNPKYNYVFPSNHSKKTVESIHSIKLPHSWVIHNGLPDEFFDVKDVKLKSKKFIIGYVGRHYGVKNPEFCLKLAELLKDRPEYSIEWSKLNPNSR